MMGPVLDVALFLYLVVGALGAAFGAFALLVSCGEGDKEGAAMGLAFVIGAPLWPLSIILTRMDFNAPLPFGEEARLAHRIRAVERETRLLEKRRELEAAEARYRAEFDRYVESGR